MFYDESSNLAALLPEALSATKELSAVMSAADAEIDALSAEIAGLADNVFAGSASGEYLSRWERILGVDSPLGFDENARRAALLARLAAGPPVNLKTLKTVIEAYMGVAADISVNGCVITVTYRGQIRVNDLAPLYATVYEIVPAVMLLDIAYRYVVWSELDAQSIDFATLDLLNADFAAFERGGWIQ